MPSASCRVSIKVIPGAPRDEIAGEHGEAIRVKLRAPPVDGKANAALLKFLAARLELRAADLRIASGKTARLKIIAITGLAADEAKRRLFQGS